MIPVRTARTTGVYGAPPGLAGDIGGLPYWRTTNEWGGTTVYSVWEPTEGERATIAAGGLILLGIVGEPIPPVSLTVLDENARGVEFHEPTDNRPPKPPLPPRDREMG